MLQVCSTKNDKTACCRIVAVDRIWKMQQKCNKIVAERKVPATRCNSFCNNRNGLNKGFEGDLLQISFSFSIYKVKIEEREERKREKIYKGFWAFFLQHATNYQMMVM